MQLRDEAAGGIACRKCAKNAHSVALTATNWNGPNLCSSALISEYGTMWDCIYCVCKEDLGQTLKIMAEDF